MARYYFYLNLKDIENTWKGCKTILPELKNRVADPDQDPVGSGMFSSDPDPVLFRIRIRLILKNTKKAF